MTIAAQLQPPTASLKGVVEILADLTWEQIDVLRENIAKTDRSPEKLGDVVEKTSPKLAENFRGHSAKDIANYAQLVVSVLQLMLQVYQIAAAVTPTQVTQIINHVETTIINLPPAAPPPAAPPAPAPPPASPPRQQTP